MDEMINKRAPRNVLRAVPLVMQEEAGEGEQGSSAQGKGGEGATEHMANLGKRKKLQYWKKLADGAIKAGKMEEHSREAAMNIAGQIARLEARFEYAYAEDGDEAARKPHCTVGMLEQMGRAEKHLADLKGRFFEMAGLDRMYLARTMQIEGQGKGGAITLEAPGMEPPPLQEDWKEGG